MIIGVDLGLAHIVCDQADPCCLLGRDEKETATCQVEGQKGVYQGD
jgi:hypothetical protein